MQPLAYTASFMSWPFLLSALQRVRESEKGIEPIDLNLETPSCVVLSCIALEAFVNEISCITSVFLFEEEKIPQTKYSALAQREAKMGIEMEKCQKIEKIQDDKSLQSFYDRYKALLKSASLVNPQSLQNLNKILELRNALVHFRDCKVPIAEDNKGVIRSSQKPPEVFSHLKSFKVNGWPVIASGIGDVGIAWQLRISTNAMAIWTLDIMFEAIVHVLDNLPAGEYRDFVLKKYMARDEVFRTVFEMGKNDLEVWKNSLFVLPSRRR